VISKKGLIVIDSTMHPRQEFVAGQWQFVKSFEKTTNTCLIKRPTEKTRHLESAIFLIGRCDENWYHFIIDTVPRILFTTDIPSNVPLIIRADIPENFKLVLSSLTERDIIEIELEENVEVQTLYVVPGRSSAFDSQPPSGTSYVEFSPSVLNGIKALLVDPAIEFDLNRQTNLYPGKIALSRSSTTRNVQNWFSLKSLIESFAFAIYDLDPDFFKNQIAAFARATIVVSPGGAAIANVIFMPLGSSIVVLRSYRNKDLRLWKKLASAMKVNCIEVTGIPTYFGPGKLRRMHSDFYISPRKLRRVLTSVTASSTR
jgi:capsular polysaccharide biosynthesis protein